jgi:hypothetical protein
MNKWKKLFISSSFFIMCLIISSCTRDNKDTKKVIEPLESAFKTFPAWPDSVKMRRVGDSFSESIDNLQVDNTGAVWFLRKAKPNPDEDKYLQYLEKYDAQGNHIFTMPTFSNLKITAGSPQIEASYNF